MNLAEAFSGLIDKAVSVLPGSPFAPFISYLSDLPFLGYLNWFLPVGWILDAMAAWLGAVALFYLVSVLLRWVKVIGD